MNIKMSFNKNLLTYDNLQHNYKNDGQNARIYKSESIEDK